MSKNLKFPLESRADGEGKLVRRHNIKSASFHTRSDSEIYTTENRGTELNELSSSSSTDFLELELNLAPFKKELSQPWKLWCDVDVVPFSDSRARIHEGLSDDLYLEKGSRLSLSCSVSDPSAPPTYVYWDGLTDPLL